MNLTCNAIRSDLDIYLVVFLIKQRVNFNLSCTDSLNFRKYFIRKLSCTLHTLGGQRFCQFFKNGSQHFWVYLHCFLNNHLWYTLRHQFRHYISAGCLRNHGPFVFQTSKFFVACCYFVRLLLTFFAFSNSNRCRNTWCRKKNLWY